MAKTDRSRSEWTDPAASELNETDERLGLNRGDEGDLFEIERCRGVLEASSRCRKDADDDCDGDAREEYVDTGLGGADCAGDGGGSMGLRATAE